jgi:hypothetical protein
MDMSKTLPKRITNDELHQRGGEYKGIVREIILKDTWSVLARQSSEQPHITFTDDYTLIPNIGMRRTLIDELGEDSDGWIGKQLTVRMEEFTSKTSGEIRYEKYISDVCCNPKTGSS